MFKKLVLLVVVVLPFSAFGATKTPNMKVCINANGAINVKQKCRGGEKVASLESLKGNTGEGGVIDPSKCAIRTVSRVDSFIANATLNCEPTEYLLTHAVKNPTSAYVNEISLGYYFLGDIGLPNVVKYTVIGNLGQGIAIEVQGVCCRK